jgi:hypothetical protein
MRPGSGKRLDGAGSALLAAALLALILPLTVGREQGWPAWMWPSLAASAVAGWAFVRHEHRRSSRGSDPLFDLAVLKAPGVAAGMLAVLLVMACYAGFLLALTLHLQGRLRFSPLHAGLIFAIYATGFGTASLTWTRLPAPIRERLPVIGPLLMGGSLVTIGLLATNAGWSHAPTTPLLLAAGVGHAWGFAPLANRLTTLVGPSRAAGLSGLLITADWIGTVLGVATFTGLYLSTEAHGSARALALTTAAIAPVLLATAIGAARATAKARTATIRLGPRPSGSDRDCPTPSELLTLRKEGEQHRDVAIVVGVTVDRDEVGDAVLRGERRVVSLELSV